MSWRFSYEKNKHFFTKKPSHFTWSSHNNAKVFNASQRMLMLLTKASCSAGVGALSAGGAGGRALSPSEQLREFPVLDVPVAFVLKGANFLK